MKTEKGNVADAERAKEAGKVGSGQTMLITVKMLVFILRVQGKY